MHVIQKIRLVAPDAVSVADLAQHSRGQIAEPTQFRLHSHRRRIQWMISRDAWHSGMPDVSTAHHTADAQRNTTDMLASSQHFLASAKQNTGGWTCTFAVCSRIASCNGRSARGMRWGAARWMSVSTKSSYSTTPTCRS